MELGTLVVAAIGLFAVTHLDNIVVLTVFFGRGAREPGATARIVAGQYLGLLGVLAVSVALTYGASFLPPSAAAYLGLIPLALGLAAARKAWLTKGDEGLKNEAEVGPEGLPGQRTSVMTVTAITFANGGDNIGVYTPVFAAQGWTSAVVYSVVFLLLAAVLLSAARFTATRRPIAKALDRWESVVYPVVLIAVGIAVLVVGGAFGL